MVVGWAAGNAANVVGDSKAGDAGPTVADFEKLESVDEGVHLRLQGARLEDDRKHARRAEEIALPEFVTGAGRKCGVQNCFDFRTDGKPRGHGECGCFDGGKAHGHGLQAAECEAAIIGRDGEAKILLRGTETLVECGITNSDRTKEQVAVTADVFGDGLHSDIYAMSESVEEHASRPGVVENHANIARVSNSDDGGKVLNFHSDGAGAFAPDEARIFLDQGRNVGADRGFVERSDHAKAVEESGGEFAIGEVDAGGNQDVVVGFEEGEIDEGNGSLATGSENGVRAGFKFADACGEFKSGRSAVKAVRIPDAILVPRVTNRGSGREDGGGTAINRGSKRVITLRNFGVGVNKLGLPGFGHDASGWKQ